MIIKGLIYILILFVAFLIGLGLVTLIQQIDYLIDKNKYVIQAKDARNNTKNKYDKYCYKYIANILKKINNDIKEACKHGQYNVLEEVHYTHSTEVKRILKSKGYNIDKETVKITDTNIHQILISWDVDAKEK